MNVVSWENGQEELYDAVKEHVVESPNSFLKSAFLFSTLKTTTQACFPSGTFDPVDDEEVLDDLFDNDPPDTIDLGDIIADSIGDIISDDNLDDVDDLLGDVESFLLCFLECGADPVLIESEIVFIGAMSDTVENIGLRPIDLGDGAFVQLPHDVQALQESLGGEDACVSVGFSLVGNRDPGAPTASFTFYVINCTDGTREEIPITGNGEFLIFLPIDGSELGDGDCDDAEVSCVSGSTLSTVVETSGCRVVEYNETYVTCGCTHLTAFSALFVPGSGGCGGGNWEWDALKTAAAAALAFCVLMTVVLLLAEHFLVFKKRKAITTKTRKRRNGRE